MSVIRYNPQPTNKEIVFCCVDDISSYDSTWAKEIVKNIANYTISNITSKGYSILQSICEDELLRTAVNNNYDYAIVYSPGTEFINGDGFFQNIKQFCQTDIFIAGHVLDRDTGYYELHSQCYFINLTIYKELDCPVVGKQELNSLHRQIIPLRSDQNLHDYHTPYWVRNGIVEQAYQHKAHGWNILSVALSTKQKIIVFDDEIRKCKKHYYPESLPDFSKQISWAYMRHNHCLTEFVHKENTEFLQIDETGFTQVLTPASGTKFLQYISQEPVVVILYDYNQKSLDYWKQTVPQLDNVTYKFLKIDLLTDELKLDILDPTLKTLINLSNIFCYEATAPFYNLEYRIYRENKILAEIEKTIPNAYIYFSGRACSGFSATLNKGVGLLPAQQTIKPTWHE